MKLWDKGFDTDKRIEKFTVGNDALLDVKLARYDITGTMAHIKMLTKVGLLEQSELDLLLPELEVLLKKAENGEFIIEEGIEDVHSQVEKYLTEKLGDLGKKIHTGRSRNDQILVDMRLFCRDHIRITAAKIVSLFKTLQEASEKYKEVLMPGYTHLQVAMPSSFGLWLGAYAESLADDMVLLGGALKYINRNPLGSAAGYGSSAPLDRKLTTKLLDFEDLEYNSICAQLGRGKSEKVVAQALAAVAETLGRFAADCCLFNSQNFGFIKLPNELTTGSSIMPHKKNPDVFELIRAHCNKIIAVPETISHIISNLPCGYFRDLQLIKEVFVPVFDEMDDCLDIAKFAVGNLSVNGQLMENPLYKTAFSVEEVNRRVAAGVPFRDAYKQVGIEIMEGRFEFNGRLNHTHEGSVGNLCTKEIAAKMQAVLDEQFK
ncbi:MAG: argininosuccinate lyase [Bacteroidales bacterium]|nr:argininosuccinate lyase [Bacteroidales bacterium]